MAEPLKKDEALAAAVREAFQRHMEAARQASQALKEKQAAAAAASPVPLTPAPTIARDPRLVVPTPANVSHATPVIPSAAPAARPISIAAKPTVEGPSLSRLVAIASPQKGEDQRTGAPEPIVETAKVLIAGTPSAPAVERPQAAAPVVEVTAPPVAEAAKRHPGTTAPLNEPQTETPPPAEASDTGFDFGEALFIEIAPEPEGSVPDEPPKMPKAASLDTPLREPVSQIGADDLEFRQPPLRERPRMSTVNVAAGPPQDLDLLAKVPAVSKPLPVEAKSAGIKNEKIVNLPPQVAAGKSATRFGISTLAKQATVNAGKASRLTIRGRLKVPFALVLSVLLAAVIAGVGGYFWANPQKLQVLSALVAPPAPPQTKVISTAPETKIAAPLPTNQVAAAPTPSPGSIAPMSVPTPAAPAATRSVSTIAITLDAVDEAVQSARELTAIGDIDGAREALESYKTGSDPRALFALAETYDPEVVKNVSKADPAQAKVFYEAAAKAGSRDNTADRIARLALVHTN